MPTPGTGGERASPPLDGQIRQQLQYRVYPVIMMIVTGVEVDEDRLAAIAHRYGIAELRIFGSRARGTARPDSDLDILYTLQPGHRLGWEIEQLADDLSELFGRPVDLLSMRSLHPLLRESVLAEAEQLYAA
jgi:predicted nucleotidyltransferase